MQPVFEIIADADSWRLGGHWKYPKISVAL